MFRRSAPAVLICSLLACILCAPVIPLMAQDAAPEPEAQAAPSPLPRAPETADEYFDAVLLMINLGRLDLAQDYLKGLLDLKPDDKTLLNLRAKHGTGTFMRLSRMDALKPYGGELIDQLTAAALAQINDPAYIDAMITDLAGSPRENAAAIDALKHLGPHAIPPLLVRLGSVGGNLDRNLLLSSIIQLGAPVVPPLTGALQTPNPQLRADVIQALGYMGTREDVLPFLWYPAFAKGQPPGVSNAAKRAISRILYGDSESVRRIPSFGIADRLHGEALKYLHDEAEWVTEADGLTPVWVWDSAAGTVAERRVSPDSASNFRGEQFARQALAFTPDSTAEQALVLAFALARDQLQVGWNQMLPEGPGTAHNATLLAGEDAAEEVLRLSLEEDNPAAAIGALRVLAQIGTRHLLIPDAEGRSPLLDALNSESPRVQFAAATTIMQLDPVKSFRDAHRVVEIFARALNSDTQSRTVVVDPNVERGGSTAGLFAQLGFETNIVTTGRDGFEAVAEQGDVELAVLHLNTIRWELSETIANLRADARTRSVPVAIYGPPGMEGRVETLMRQNQPAFYVSEADTPLDLARKVRPQLARISPPPLSETQRDVQVTSAAFWLRHIAEGRRTDVFDLSTAQDALSSAVGDPRVAGEAIVTLGAIGSAAAQQRLADAALAPGFELPIRETAARQLAFHIQQFGILLPNSSIDALTNAAQAETNPALQTALDTVIGSLKPSAEVVGARLQNLPAAELPVP